ncbi:molecular chaperone, HSP90 family [Solibacillus silvestris StLB046]|uniref:Molecular chaperone, HSP90 family n=1 Tax=Solibacillus silvestris (strain StLB046) TaxID=1002809 RepID=F2F2N7_SOLSS|nr:replication-relaxation family protein [Solibacillus silvestris]BAK15875.1 molecular chaperone, HSP90 family [Solibacillus silvestris StLB046]
MKVQQLSLRDEQILLLLKKFDFLTRDQLNSYFKLGTVRNTNYVLRNLSEYLKTIRDGYQSIYYLSREGREYVDCEKVRKKGGHVQHVVMRNEIWLHFKCPKDWRNEVKISDEKTCVVADAVFTRNGFYHFLEVDNLQSMKENRAKINRYKELSDSLVKQFGYFPTLVWLTTTEHRRKQLESACNGLNFKVFTIKDIL